MISYELNNKILRLAPKHTISDLAPDTFEKLMSNATSGLVVWSGASENTIYGDPAVNYAFRAWHDSLHIKYNIPFTLEGELRVALEQVRIINSDTMGKIIIAEVYGQAEHFYKTGKFPIDQVNYVKGMIQ